MSLKVQRAEFFTADFEKQFAWYVDRAGAELARRFQAALDKSLGEISNQPDLGRPRHFRHPELQHLRGIRLRRHLTQTKARRLPETSQSRLAPMEAGDPAFLSICWCGGFLPSGQLARSWPKLSDGWR